MLQKFIRQNTSFTKTIIHRITSFRKISIRLAVVLNLLFMTAALSYNASAQTTVSQYFQGFEVDNIWASAPPSAQTVNRVPSGSSGITSRTGGFHAEVGTQFTRWGGYNSTFPSRGYTTTVAVYLNVGGGFANDTRFDFSSAINNTTGAHRRDFVFNAGYYNDAVAPGSGPRFVVSASNNSGRANSFPKNASAITITSSGWYIFKHRFYNSGGGVLAVEMSIIDSSNNIVNSWIISNASDVIGSTVGGNRYGWFANNEFAFLAIDDSERANIVETFAVDDDGMASAADCNAADAASVTIQGAVDTALSGDTIKVCDGTYVEDVNVNKANLIINGSGVGNTTISGAIGGDGATVRISAASAEIKNFTITRQGNNTTDWNDPGLNSAGIAIQGAIVPGALIHDNIITGNRNAIDINNSSGHTIRNNVIDNNRTGVIFRNQTDNITMTENFITNNWTLGVLFLDASGGTNSPVQTAANGIFSNNNFSGNWYAQVVDRQTGGSLPAPNTTNLKNFRGNWWGTTSPVVTTANSAEPGYAAQIPVAYGGTATAPGGQPDIAGAASANIKYMPLLTSGTDTNVETTPGRGTFGFQGAASIIIVKPSMLNGWSAVSQRTASGSFVYGPGTPPLGSGSYRMMTGAGNSGPDLPQGGAGQGGKTWITTQQFDNVLLSGITRLGYSTYVTASPSSAGNIITPTLQLQIDLDGNGTRDSTMIFEPYYSSAASGGTQSNVALGQWQTWDARAGKWWFNNATVFGCGQCAFPTFDAIIAAYPNAKIVTWYALADGYGTQFVAGQNSAGAPWANFDGNIDAFTITANAPDTTFDFEPLAPTAASVSISGQVLTAAGENVPNAKVILLDSQGMKRAAISNGFGYYSFEGVTVGETYVLNVVSKRYTFTPQVVNVNEELTALNLIAEL